MVKGMLPKVSEAAEGLVRGMSLELIDVEFAREGGRSHLRISIDGPDGVTVEDCAKASAMIGKVLERDGLMPDSCVLEVMSPGLYRCLKTPEDFGRNVGKKVKVKLKQPFEGTHEEGGLITGAGDEYFTLDRGEEVVELKYESISSARLDPELPW